MKFSANCCCGCMVSFRIWAAAVRSVLSGEINLSWCFLGPGMTPQSDWASFNPQTIGLKLGNFKVTASAFLPMPQSLRKRIVSKTYRAPNHRSNYKPVRYMVRQRCPHKTL